MTVELLGHIGNALVLSGIISLFFAIRMLYIDLKNSNLFKEKRLNNKFKAII